VVFSVYLAGDSAVNVRKIRLPLTKIDAYLDSCFERESAPRVSEVAKWLGLSRRKLMETFLATVGGRPSEYMKDRQIGAAKLLLAHSDLRVDRVAYATGFGTRRTFFREFRQRTGLSPAAYRKRAQNVSRLNSVG
jgi:AraC family transcriptional activator FtrA